MAGAPTRVWRDWALVAVASVAAVLETTLRSDAEFRELPLGWRVASLAAFFAAMVYPLLVRRTRPLRAMAVGFGVLLGFGVLMSVLEGPFGGLVSGGFVLVVVYALYRWGSGREGAVGGVLLLAALVVGTISDPTARTVGNVFGSFIVLSVPVELGLVVRYQRVAQERAVAGAKSREREVLARELHDTVAHHLSAIAVQAQAGQAVAAQRPAAALEVLAVVEDEASRALSELRLMLGTLRAGAEAELTPRHGLADLARLARSGPDGLRVEVDVQRGLDDVGPAVGAALYRIAQESVANAVRHARRATWVRVRVEPAGELVQLTVVDDGEGGPGGEGRGFGLLGMAERAQLLGGRFQAGPAAGRGWQVQAELPMRSGS